MIAILGRIKSTIGCGDLGLSNAKMSILAERRLVDPMSTLSQPCRGTIDKTTIF